MPGVKSLEELRRLREETLEKRKTAAGRAHIVVGMGTCGIAAGAKETMKAILDTVEAKNMSDILVTQTGCIGLCAWEPIVEVMVSGESKVTYGKVSPQVAMQIMKEHIEGGKVLSEHVIPS
jgi:NADP-reducing hydrogenase subunit HndB